MERRSTGADGGGFRGKQHGHRTTMPACDGRTAATRHRVGTEVLGAEKQIYGEPQRRQIQKNCTQCFDQRKVSQSNTARRRELSAARRLSHCRLSLLVSFKHLQPLVEEAFCDLRDRASSCGAASAMRKTGTLQRPRVIAHHRRFMPLFTALPVPTSTRYQSTVCKSKLRGAAGQWAPSQPMGCDQLQCK